MTAAAVLAVTWGASLRNTFDFLNQRTVDLSADMERDIQAHLLPAEDFAHQTIAAINDGTVDPTDKPAFAQWLMGGLAAMPQARAIALVKPGYDGWSVHRADGPIKLQERSETPHALVDAAFRDATTRPREPYWGDVVHVQNTTLINLRTLIDWPEGGQAILAVVISLQDLSRLISHPERTPGWTSFILYGKSTVLAHPYIAENPSVLTTSQPLLPLSILPDPVLRRIWDGETNRRFADQGRPDTEIRFDPPDDPSHVFILEKTERFGDRPWYFGSYTELDEVNDEFERAIMSGMVSLILVLISVGVAVWIGHRLAQPLQRTATAAGHIGRLELDHLAPLPRSRVREFDQQANAFNQMAEGLRSFSTYVPKPLVSLLASRGFRADIPPETQEVTILFTDIVGFTSQTERMTADQTAALLNEHFGLLGQAIHENGGVIDKYVGDSVMAFWTVTLAGEDAPAMAVSAARQIADLLRKDNRRRALKDWEPVRIRIGVHTGPALVGNIGAEERVNFTVVGDTVNVAQRLQDYGRFVDDDAECVILTSDTTAEALPEEERGERIGALPIRGRSADIIGWRI